MNAIASGVLPAASVSRRDAVMREIRRAIVTGSLHPGDKLTEVKLSASLNVSRPTVREALNQLAAEGLLVQEPYRGLRVAHVPSSTILDIAKTRMALDLEAVRDILEDKTGHRLRLLEQAWEKYERVALDPDPMTQHDGHIAFHQGIWAASENTMLLRLWPVVEAHLTIVVAQDQVTRADPERALQVHRRLMDAIASRKMKAITAAFTAHTMDSARELIAILEQEGVSA